MTAKKDTVMVELPRRVAVDYAENCIATGAFPRGDAVIKACRAALEAEKVAEREAWAEERDRLLSGWVQQKEEVEDRNGRLVADRNGRLVAATYGSADGRAVRATFIASAPDMAALLERLALLNPCELDERAESLALVSEAAALLRRNGWLPPEGE